MGQYISFFLSFFFLSLYESISFLWGSAKPNFNKDNRSSWYWCVEKLRLYIMAQASVSGMLYLSSETTLDDFHFSWHRWETILNIKNGFILWKLAVSAIESTMSSIVLFSVFLHVWSLGRWSSYFFSLSFHRGLEGWSFIQRNEWSWEFE